MLLALREGGWGSNFRKIASRNTRMAALTVCGVTTSAAESLALDLNALQ